MGFVRIRHLKPIYERESYHRGLADYIDDYWNDLIYKPLLDALNGNYKEERYNSRPVVFSVGFSELLPCPHNREINPVKVDEIKSEILRSQNVKPLVVTQVLSDSGLKFMVTDGHHRMEALRQLIDESKFKTELMVPAVASDSRGIKTADGVGNVRLNSRSALIAALRGGKIHYYDGYFFGNFSASISRILKNMGAKFDSRKIGFKLPLQSIDVEIRSAIAESLNRSRDMQKIIDRHLDRVQEKSGLNLDFKPEFEKVLTGLEKQFKETTAPAIGVSASIPPEMKQAISIAYSTNLDLYVKNWTDEAILRMRQRVEENVMQGFRADKLAETIRKEQGVSERKAQFLARQETSLLTSKYREERYKDAGIDTFTWSTSGDVRVRPDHKELNGHVFSWNNPPPITNRATGNRNWPGADFGCRCVAIPIVKF